MDKQRGRRAKTLYIGGGTPSVLKGGRLALITESAACAFLLSSDAEITCELNPADVTDELANDIVKAGINRVSMGVQSGIDSELKKLGRRHSAHTAEIAVNTLRRAGIKNISLDLMLGVPLQTEESLLRSVDYLASLEPEHISAYILKIEPNTPYDKIKDELNLPDDDMQAKLYLSAVDALFQHGYKQYEISNFSKPQKESRHNLIYWDCGEYIGFGPSAHSFFDGRRSFYPRALATYIAGNNRIDDGEGGSLEEYIMLRLRLSEGLVDKDLQIRYGIQIPEQVRRYAELLEKNGLAVCSERGISLTAEGFLVSNSIISEIIDRF